MDLMENEIVPAHACYEFIQERVQERSRPQQSRELFPRSNAARISGECVQESVS